MEENQTESFDPQMAMWLTLPGAAMCSIPIGLWVVPNLLAGTGFPFGRLGSEIGGVLILLLIPVTAITSREAYRHCISTVGNPGTRMVLMIVNFLTRGIADLCIAMFVIGSIIAMVGAIVTAFTH